MHDQRRAEEKPVSSSSLPPPEGPGQDRRPTASASPSELRIRELEAQLAARRRQAAEAAAHAANAAVNELEAQLALEMARSQASSHTSPSALHAGSRARAGATQLHDLTNLQVVQSEILLPTTLQTPADMAGPAGANGILPTNVHLDGCSLTRIVAP